MLYQLSYTPREPGRAGSLAGGCGWCKPQDGEAPSRGKTAADSVTGAGRGNGAAGTKAKAKKAAASGDAEPSDASNPVSPGS